MLALTDVYAILDSNTLTSLTLFLCSLFAIALSRFMLNLRELGARVNATFSLPVTKGISSTMDFNSPLDGRPEIEF